MPCADDHCTDPRCCGTPTREQIAKIIREQGQQIMAVLGSENQPGFAYTIGRTERGHPELLILANGFDELMAFSGMLNFLGCQDVQDGHFIGLTDGRLFAATDVKNDQDLFEAAHEELVIQADEYYGRPVDVLFLVPLEDRKLFLPSIEIDGFPMAPAPGIH